jgi:predicted CXXCH cytochrome family protein
MRCSTVRGLVLASLLAALSRGQQLDTVLLREGTAKNPFTIIDQVAYSKERRAFLTLYHARDPQKRRKLAEAFVETHPQSWLLAQVYDLAAKACIDLDDYGPAQRFGSQSLRLLPENPLLLVPLANMQAQMQQLAAAEESARSALDYLDQFDRPASVALAKWSAIHAELKASSYFALGRVAVDAAMHETGAKKQQKLVQAENSLVQARILNASDPEIAYLLGITELSLEKPENAAFYFAQAQRTPGPLQAKALENLERIYKSSPRPSVVSFETFLASAEAVGELTVAATPPVPPGSPGTSTSSYAGSQACQPCHAAIYASWQKTGMGRMLRPYRPENVMGDFRLNNQFTDETGSVVARMSVKREKHSFAVRSRTGEWFTYPIDYTIGSKWQQAYATRLASGDIQVFPVQYSAINGRWINYWKVIDPPGSLRSEVTGFNQLGPETSYQLNCAPCHTSQLRGTKPGSTNGQDFTFREGGINCEMCHGPAQDHVLTVTATQRHDNSALQTLVDFRNVSARKYVAICGQCHAQSALHKSGPEGEMNYSARGASFPPTYRSRPYTEILRRAFYKDGRFRETTFIVEAFRRTACFRKGQAHCGHCHQPHAPDSSSNPTSLKYLGDPDRMCLQCHGKFASNITAHTHHAPDSEGSHCVSCHMPRIMNSLLFKARTHQIDDIPDAAMTERFGPEESPNACLLCHPAKDSQWVRLQLRAW